MTPQEELPQLRRELRYLRIYCATLDRARLAQKKKADRLAELLEERDKLIKKLEKEKVELEKLIEELKRVKDTYRGMIYKPNQKKPSEERTGLACRTDSQRLPGGQVGHPGVSRKLPPKVNSCQRLFFHHCPFCHQPLSRGETTLSHTVEDLPSLTQLKTTIIRYESERQWCSHCQKEVIPNPAGVIPHSRLGINLIVQVLVWRYGCKMPLAIVQETLKQTYGVKLSQGTLVDILHRTRRWLGPKYDELLTLIRGSPLKHADETGWRIAGLNTWLWGFLNQEAAYYTIEETRGKGVPQKILSASREDDVLVRDDYPAYEKLPLRQQSCWAHLLRKSHEEVVQPNVSAEMVALHGQLKEMFAALTEIIQKPFEAIMRQKFYQDFASQLQQLRNNPYQAEDAKRIQVRLKNQGNNLLTALLFEDVPLTNNLAERALRPLVVMRKISGGSRSVEGAATLAVNASIIQTIKMRNQPLFSTLYDLILAGATGKS
jgi:transposase